MSKPVLYAADGISRLRTEADDATPTITISTGYDHRTGIAKVMLKLPGKEIPLSIFQAQALGLQLIQRSEAAVLNAAALRMMTSQEAGNMPIELAIPMWQELTGDVASMHVQLEQAKLQKEVKNELTEQAKVGEHGTN